MEKEEEITKNTDGSHDNKDANVQHDSLREFVTKECKSQLQTQGNQGEEDAVEQERMNQFFQRAISESERMNAEVSKSRAQQQKLYEELGKDMFESWSKDHASEVLTPEQYQSWKNEEEKLSRDFLLKKMLEKKISDEDSCR